MNRRSSFFTQSWRFEQMDRDFYVTTRDTILLRRCGYTGEQLANLLDSNDIESIKFAVEILKANTVDLGLYLESRFKQYGVRDQVLKRHQKIVEVVKKLK